MNKQQIELQPALVLHSRAYRETSFIVELFTQDYGRIPVVARGVRSRKTWQGLLQPFVPALISWSGKDELMALKDVEANGAPYWLTGRRLLSGFYLNELLMRLVHRHDPHPGLFHYYQTALHNLQTLANEEYALRLFEKQLLDELGYGLAWQQDTLTSEPIQADKFYQFNPEQGLLALDDNADYPVAANKFTGRTLLAIANESLTEADLADAKRLMRLALASLLGDKPLKTRELFI